MPPDADIQKEYEQYERDSLNSEIEEFAYTNNLDEGIVFDLFLNTASMVISRRRKFVIR